MLSMPNNHHLPILHLPGFVQTVQSPFVISYICVPRHHLQTRACHFNSMEDIAKAAYILTYGFNRDTFWMGLSSYPDSVGRNTEVCWNVGWLDGLMGARSGRYLQHATAMDQMTDVSESSNASRRLSARARWFFHVTCESCIH